MTNQVNIKAKITNQQIDDIMVTALEGGINYWVAKVNVDHAPKEFKWASDVISQGGTLEIIDDEDGKSLFLDKEKFLKGFGLAKTDGNGFDLEGYDAGDADRVIQYAVFGKLIYG